MESQSSAALVLGSTLHNLIVGIIKPLHKGNCGWFATLTSPNKSQVFPASALRLKSLNTTESGQEGYENLTCWNSISPRTLSITSPFVSLPSISGTLSFLLNILEARNEASMKYFGLGSADPRELHYIYHSTKKKWRRCAEIHEQLDKGNYARSLFEDSNMNIKLCLHNSLNVILSYFIS